MSIAAKYVHTNLIAEDWRALADFYERVLGCTLVPPERDYQGELFEAGTGIPGAHSARTCGCLATGIPGPRWRSSITVFLRRAGRRP